MNIREHALTAALWLTVLMWSIWLGGTVYQMLVIVPLWSAAPPDSVRAFFQGTDYNRTIFHFFGPPFMAARTLPLIVALLMGWHLPRHRRTLLLASACHLFAVLFTLIHIYPINAVLFLRAGGDHSPEEIRAMVSHWILVDRFRFAVGTVEWLALLWAFKLAYRPSPGVVIRPPASLGTDAATVSSYAAGAATPGRSGASRSP